MANTVSVFLDTIEGVDSTVYADVTFSGTYATGGETLTPDSFGLSVIKDVTATVSSLSTVTNVATFDRATGKLILVAPAGTQVANSTSLTGVTAKVRVVGA